MDTNQLKEILRLHECWLRGGPEGKRANLSSANLSGADLYYANLYGANLSDADLYCANLYYANLYCADLSGANLSGADLSRANLYCADLSRANLDNIKISWSSHALISEILWRAANTEPRQMLAAFVGRKLDWCWDHWTKYQHPERRWALGVLRTYATEGAGIPVTIQEALDTARRETTEEERTITDDCGNTWPRYCHCGGEMQVVRPGDARCAECDSQVPDPEPDVAGDAPETPKSKVPGDPITIREALDTAQRVLETAERERIPPDPQPDLCPTCQMLSPMHQVGCSRHRSKPPQPDAAGGPPQRTPTGGCTCESLMAAESELAEARRRAFEDLRSSCCHKKLLVEEFGGRIVWVCASCKVACVSQRKKKEA